MDFREQAKPDQRPGSAPLPRLPGPARRSADPAEPAVARHVLAMQLSAGNAATRLWLQRAASMALVGGSGLERKDPAGPRRALPSFVVQRHNSYEHQLLGDTSPTDIANAKQLDPETKGWRHLVEDEFDRVTFFRSDPAVDPRAAFPQIRWIQLGRSKLWVSSGELSAFGDYLPNPETIDGLPPEKLTPILQRMRQEISRAIYDRLTGGTAGLKTEDAEAEVRERNRKTTFAGAAKNTGMTKRLPTDLVGEDVQAVEALDAASSGLGPNRQKGLLSRNACHFAPFSWERWSLYHNEARAIAAQAFAEGKTSALSMRRNPKEMSALERKAWVTNGYSNHFLQDSFAAGHLINKTLVMQWFVEYINLNKHDDHPHFGLPGDDVMKGMTTKAQPGVADRRAYTHTRLNTTASQDRRAGKVATDPQTTLERADQEGRLAGSGVQSKDPEATKEYKQYEEFLNSAYISLAANDIHDFFNHNGLRVQNAAGNEFVVGGDGTLLKEDPSVIEITLKADNLADQAIHEFLTTGTSSVEVKTIFDLFPSQVWAEFDSTGPGGQETTVKTGFLSLEKWNDDVVRKVCETEIFPKMAESFSYKVVRAPGIGGAKLIDAGGNLTPQE